MKNVLIAVPAKRIFAIELLFAFFDINPKTIDIALNSLKNIGDEEARNYLHYELSKWKNGDFDITKVAPWLIPNIDGSAIGFLVTP